MVEMFLLAFLYKALATSLKTLFLPLPLMVRMMAPLVVLLIVWLLVVLLVSPIVRLLAPLMVLMARLMMSLVSSMAMPMARLIVPSIGLLWALRPHYPPLGSSNSRVRDPETGCIAPFAPIRHHRSCNCRPSRTGISCLVSSYYRPRALMRPRRSKVVVLSTAGLI